MPLIYEEYLNYCYFPPSLLGVGNFSHFIYTWETRQIRLYNVKKDISEQNDLSQTMPDKVKGLTAELSDYLRERDAQRPSLKATGEVIPFPDEQ